ARLPARHPQLWRRLPDPPGPRRPQDAADDEQSFEVRGHRRLRPRDRRARSARGPSDRPLAEVPRGEEEQDGAPAEARLGGGGRRVPRMPPVRLGIAIFWGAVLGAAAASAPAFEGAPPSPAPWATDPGTRSCSPGSPLAVVGGTPIGAED